MKFVTLHQHIFSENSTKFAKLFTKWKEYQKMIHTYTRRNSVTPELPYQRESLQLQLWFPDVNFDRPNLQLNVATLNFKRIVAVQSIGRFRCVQFGMAIWLNAPTGLGLLNFARYSINGNFAQYPGWISCISKQRLYQLERSSTANQCQSYRDIEAHASLCFLWNSLQLIPMPELLSQYF